MALFESRRTTSAQLAHASAMVAGTLLLLPAAAMSAPGERPLGRFQQFKLDNPELSRRDFKAEFKTQRVMNREANINLSNVTANPAKNIERAEFRAMRIEAHEQRMQDMIRFSNQSSQLSDSGHIVRVNSGVDIDLSSTQQNITLGEKLFQHVESVTIESDGVPKTFSAGSKVTAAEYIACKQVLVAGKQTVQLDGNGRAIGGDVDLAALTSRNDRLSVDDLFIPTNLNAYGDVSKRGSFQVTGDLVNAGSLYVYSSGKNPNKGFLRANNITNEETGLISSTLSNEAAAQQGGSLAPVDLDIHANNAFTNHGIIESSGSLNITANEINNTAATAGGAKPALKSTGNLNISAPQIVNNGLIQSSNSNVNFDNHVAADLTVANHNGVISALNGAINLRSSAYNDSFNTYLNGGDLLSETVNVNSGKGTADLAVDKITGVLNETGLASHVAASTGTLTLGTICLTGDPTYKNDAGSIVLSGNITVGEALTIIATENITNTTALTITAGDGSKGYPITLIAGAEITSSSGTNTTTLPSGNTGSMTTISGKSSVTGGNIILTSLSGGAVVINARSTNTKGNSNGADVLMVAYNNAGGTAGVVTLTGSTVNSGGRGTGTNGGIKIISDGKDGAGITAVQTGTLNSSGGTGGAGAIMVNCIRPDTTLGGPVTYNVNGTLASVDEISTGSVVQNNASVTVDGNITAGTSIVIACGGGNQDLIDIKAGVTLKTISPLSGVQLQSRFSSDIAQAAGSFISTNKLTLFTSTGNFGSAANPLLTNAKYISVNGDNLVTEAYIKNTNTQIVSLEGDAVKLDVTATGNIISGAAGITAANLVLKSTAGSIGLTRDAALEVDSFTVQFQAKTNVFAHNDYNGATALNGINSAGGIYSVSTDGDLHNNPGFALTAPQVELTTLTGFQSSFDPTINATTSISLTSTNNISNAFVNTANMKTPLLILNSANNIGSSALNRFTLGAGIGGVKANALSVFLNSVSTNTKGFNLAGGNATNDDFTLDTLGGVNITGNVSADGDLQIIAAKGFVNVKPAVQLLAHRDLMLRVSDTSATASKSKITIGKGASIATLADTAGLGRIDFSIGPVSLPIQGKAPTKGLSYAENNGTVFFGLGGITAKGSGNSMYAKGANIVINNPYKATNISLAGNVNIVADPPVANNEVIWIGEPTGRAPLTQSLSSPILALEVLSTSLPGNIPIVNTANLQNDSRLNNSWQNLQLDSFFQFNGTMLSALPGGNTSNIDQDDSVVTTYGAPSGAISSTLCASAELATELPTSEHFAPLHQSAQLSHGHSVLIADRDLELNSLFGKVKLRKGAVVFISTNKNQLSVFNLHDNQKNSVAIELCGQEPTGQNYSLAPGQHLTVSTASGEDFASINPVEAIAHRSLTSKTFSAGFSIFTSEFSIPTALNSVSSLKTITSSTHPQTKKLKDKVLKTAAVLMYLGGSRGDFQNYTRPQVTALYKPRG